MMCLFLSLLQGAVIFLFLDKRWVYIWKLVFKLNCQDIHERIGFSLLILVKIVINWSVFGQISLYINRKCFKFWCYKNHCALVWNRISHYTFVREFVHCILIIPELHRFFAYTKRFQKEDVDTVLLIESVYYIHLHLRNRSTVCIFWVGGGHT